MTLSRTRWIAAAGVVAVSLTLSACSAGGGGGAGAPSKAGSGAKDRKSIATVSQIAVGTKADSQGPAAPEPGAKKGGTVHMIGRDDFSHLDPQRIYLNYNANASLLFTRQLTGYKDTSGGKVLVGDLATDTGTTTDGGKTWSFTLKDGLSWQDGSSITSADIRHSFERSFADFITEGPTYAQTWLAGPDYRKAYPGPYKGKHLKAIKTPDDKTIIFTLKEAHPDFNFTVAMTGYGAVPKAHDTAGKYDKKPFSSGPYEIVSHVTDKSMTLRRNPHWDPATDPIRNAYPDSWEMEFGVQALQSTDRFIADTGSDKTAMSLSNGVASERVQSTLSDAALMKRSIQGLTPFTTFYNINTKRITDVKVRQALVKAFPLQQIRQVEGGPTVGDFASTVMSPTVSGYTAFDLYGKKTKPQGDPEGAKALLEQAGKVGQKVVYAYNQTPTQEKVTVAIKTALEKAGFTVVAKPLNATTYYDATGKVDNPYDLYWGGWAADWPTGSTAIQPLFDGRQIADGASNYAHFNDAAVNQAIDAANAVKDPVEAGKAWAAVDRQIMQAAPIIPEFYSRTFGLYGSGLGGVRLDPLQGEASPLNVYVK
ncbi:ABC transporter substrate-binding protein [Streptomyces sp. NPDC056661]|uniref:ABC transporter substrate-binding protein n=1 Tax=Streptomyces sp. NPDC056661 TaxID=3345898 RepID=UPI0036BFE029